MFPCHIIYDKISDKVDAVFWKLHLIPVSNINHAYNFLQNCPLCTVLIHSRELQIFFFHRVDTNSSTPVRDFCLDAHVWGILEVCHLVLILLTLTWNLRCSDRDKHSDKTTDMSFISISLPRDFFLNKGSNLHTFWTERLRYKGSESLRWLQYFSIICSFLRFKI